MRSRFMWSTVWGVDLCGVYRCDGDLDGDLGGDLGATRTLNSYVEVKRE